MKILSFVEHYLPGYRGGGALRTLSNMVSLMTSFNFIIVTKNQDSQTSIIYEDIKSNDWNEKFNSNIFYASSNYLNIFNYIILFKNLNFDILYLNSFFNYKFSILPFIAFKISKKRNKPILIAPRGEFSENVYKIKAYKKIPFLFFSNLIKLYKNVYWHASSEIEKKEIITLFKVNPNRIFVAPDLLNIRFENDESRSIEDYSSADVLKIIFASRIVVKKNLIFALNLLSKTNLNIEFSIVGPIEDQLYWNKCQEIIKNLPSNISVIFHGDLPHTSLLKEFEKNDLFLFPTFGENFGHVILESLSVGTPVLVSTNVPWDNMTNALIRNDLKDEGQWLNAILKFNDVIYKKLSRENALNYYKKYIIKNQKHILVNENMFQSLVQKF